MVKMETTELKDYEKKDPLWWLQHHKSTIANLALRLEQVLDGRTELEPICRVLIENVKKENDIKWTYMGDEKPSR
tara:strand:- start:43 stop:267 length:225 start_codon:yes stop_codon:yes gene_type:complete